MFALLIQQLKINFINNYRAYQLMNAKLKKLGLSDTKNQIKSHTPKGSSIKTSKDASSSRTGAQQHQLNPSLSAFKLGKGVDSEQLVLNTIIGLIKKKQKQFCNVVGHDRNAIKYICLTESCEKRTGCSYCILEQHKNHNKIQAKVCLNDLIELQQKVQVNRQILITQTLIKKQELLMRIDRQIYSIRQQFLNGLEYINKRIKQSIENKFSEAIASLAYNSQSKLSNFDKASKNKIEQTVRQLDKNEQVVNQDDSIISKFMLSEFKPQLKSTPKPRVEKYKQDYQLSLIKKEDQHQILTKLSRLNITYIEEYLKQEIIQAKSFITSFKIYQEYYAELNSSILQMFASFKRAIPNVKSYEVGLIEPQIFKAYTFRKA